MSTMNTVKWKWAGVAAACFLLVAIGATIALSSGVGDGTLTNIGGVMRNYKNGSSSKETSSAMLWRWDELNIWEQYSTAEYDGRLYCTRARSTEKDMLGDELGEVVAVGYDYYSETDKKKTKTFKAYEVRGISKDLMICLDLDGTYTLFLNDEKRTEDMTLSEMFKLVDLEKHLTLGYYTKKQGKDKQSFFTLDDDTGVWQILKDCGSAKITNDCLLEIHDQNSLSFSATSNTIGVYKRSFIITEEGYLWTNIFDRENAYFIGKDKAQEIYSYVGRNSHKSEYVPYMYTLAGTVVGFEQGYVLIDDSVMCKDAKQGIVFRVPTDKLQISRAISGMNIREGDTVAITFDSQIDTENGYVVNDPWTISPARIFNGTYYISE